MKELGLAPARSHGLARDWGSKFDCTKAEIVIMCGSIEVDVWRARIGLFAARISSRLPKRWRKIKKQVASMLFTQSVFAGSGACSFGCGSNFKHKRETRLMAVLMSLLLATSVMNVSLLLRCGDIETNPGPGRYSGMPAARWNYDVYVKSESSGCRLAPRLLRVW